MAFQERRALFEALEKQRDCRIISLFNSDRPSDLSLPAIQTQLAQDDVPVLHKHLREIGDVEHIGLILHTRGGDTNVPWPLVNGIRSYCGRFTVFVPFRAHSAGTLIATGADEIIMTKVAELSPIDPTVANQFNPRDQGTNIPFGISVEDLAAFIELAKSRVGVGEKDVAAILESLTKDISPIALGNVQRSHNQIRVLANKLLGLHMDVPSKEATTIVDKLTEKLYSHLHFINRKESREHIGLAVTDSSEDEEELLQQVYEDYSTELHLDEEFKVRDFLGTNLQAETTFQGAFIESAVNSDLYEGRCRISQSAVLPDNVLVQLLRAGQTINPQLIPGLPTRLDGVSLGAGWVRR